MDKIRKFLKIIYSVLLVSLTIFIVAACSVNEKTKESNSEETEEKFSEFDMKNTDTKENEVPVVQEDTTNQSIELVFEGMNLLIKNKTDETISIIESSTEFFIKINNEWQPYGTIRSALVIQSYIPSKSEVSYDFSRKI